MSSLFNSVFGSNVSSLTSSTAGTTSSMQSEQPHLETPEMELPNETTAVDSSVNTANSNVENNTVEISDVEIVNGVEVEQNATQSTNQTQVPVQSQNTVPLQPMTQSTSATAQPATNQTNKGTYFYSNGITYKTFSNMDEFMNYLEEDLAKDPYTRRTSQCSFGNGVTTKTFRNFYELAQYISKSIGTNPNSAAYTSQPISETPNQPTETTNGPFTYSDGKISETFPTLLGLIDFLEKSCETEPLNPSTQFTFGDGKTTKTFSTYSDLVNYITNYTFDFVGNRYNTETETGAKYNPKYNPKLMYFDLMFGNSGKCDCARCSAEANATNAANTKNTKNTKNTNSADNTNKAGQSSQSNTTDQPSQSDEKKENPLLDFFQKMTELIKTKCTCPSCTERRNAQTTTPAAATSESQVPVNASTANNTTLPTAPPVSANIKPLPNLSNVYANLSNCPCVLCSAMQGRRPATTVPSSTDLPSSGVQATNLTSLNTANPINLTYLTNSTNLEYKEGPVSYNNTPTNDAPPKCNDCMDQPEYSETTGDSEVTEDTMDSPNDDAAREYISPCRNANCIRCSDAKEEVNYNLGCGTRGLEDPRAKYGNNWRNYFNFGSRKTPTTEEPYVPLLMNTAFATKYTSEDNANGYLKALTSSNVRKSAQLNEADLYKYFDMDLINSVASATSQVSLRVDPSNALYAKVRLEKDMTVGGEDLNCTTYVYGPALLARLHRYINDRYPYQKGIEFHVDGLGFTLNAPSWAMN